MFGLGAHAKQRAERLAGLGYVALAADLHGEQYLTKGLQEAMGLMGVLRETPSKLRARCTGPLEALLARPEVDPARIGAIGYCFGGTMALELARSGAAVGAVVGFHSGLSTHAPEDAKNIKGRVLACIGADDPGVPADQRLAFEKEMREGGVNWQLSVYGGVKHSFTNRRRTSSACPISPPTTRRPMPRSWSEMLTVFAEAFTN